MVGYSFPKAQNSPSTLCEILNILIKILYYEIHRTHLRLFLNQYAEGYVLRYLLYFKSITVDGYTCISTMQSIL